MTPIPDPVRWALAHERTIPDEALRREVLGLLEFTDVGCRANNRADGEHVGRPLYSHREHAAAIWRLLDRIAEMETEMAEAVFHA